MSNEELIQDILKLLDKRKYSVTFDLDNNTTFFIFGDVETGYHFSFNNEYNHTLDGMIYYIYTKAIEWTTSTPNH